VAKIMIRLMFAAAALAAASCLDIPVSYAFGDAPWCAVIPRGDEAVYWDCQYRAFEACYPNALADHGFCNLNPWPGPTTPTAATHSRHQKRYVQQH
jgi:hypothetical protein